jgi:uncharacterized protein YndB with AHSA1/START domain
MSSDPLIKTISIAAPPSMAWQVLITPELIAQWMADDPVEVHSDWKTGAPILIRGILHGMAFENRGIIERFDPGVCFEYSYWSTLSADRLDDRPENRSHVRFDLKAEGEGTRLTLTLSRFPEPSIRPHANLYWNGTLPVLKAMAEQLAKTDHA